MATIGARDLSTNTVLDADICIIGSGPAGLSIALQFVGTGADVIVLESGGTDPDPEVEDLSEIDSVGVRRAPQDVTRARRLGGTSSLWSGRCGIFDPIDFAPRSWVPESGWPIDERDLAPYFDRAGRLLGLGPARYRGQQAEELSESRAVRWDRRSFEPVVYQASVHEAGRTDALRTFVADGVEGAEHIGVLQHAGAPRAVDFGEAYGPSLRAASDVRVVTGMTVTEIRTADDGTAVRGVDATSIDGTRRLEVRAPRVVVCAGGIDNARLLLASRSDDPRGVGNRHDMVGRYLMDHPFTATVVYRGSGSTELRRQLGHRWVDVDGIRHVYSVGVRLSPERQRREGLLNGAIHMVEHGERESPLREAAQLAGAVRRGQVGGDTLATAWRVARRPDRVATGAYDRFVLRRPSLTDPDRVDFGAVVEQVPDRSSRVTLSDRLDGTGRPRAQIDWRAADAEFETMVRMTTLFQDEIQRLGLEAPERMPWLERGADEWRTHIHDMAHPMGSTRMSSDPTSGVVDEHCEVHGVRGLYVAGGSVFPTAGHMNPTLMIVSLALRLADHLRSEMSRTGTVTTTSTVPVPGAVRRLRVGVVGTDERIATSHLPVLESLPGEFEVVGEVDSATGTAIEELIARGPDVLLVAFPPEELDASVAQLVELGIPLFVEPPLSWDLRVGQSTVRRIDQLGLLVGVCEQTPFLPLEQLQQMVVSRGLIGRPYLVRNDGLLFEHHALAALSAYLDPGSRPVAALARGEAAADDLTGEIVHDDGARLEHHAPWDPARPGAHVRIEGPFGALQDGTLAQHRPDGRPLVSSVERVERDGRLQALVLATGDGEVRWNNPFRELESDLDDDQIAVATVWRGMRNAVLTGGDLPYSAARSLEECSRLTAFRYSARRGGRPVPLPMRATVERVRSVATPKLVADATKRAVGKAVR